MFLPMRRGVGQSSEGQWGLSLMATGRKSSTFDARDPTSAIIVALLAYRVVARLVALVVSALSIGALDLGGINC
jgi:hypothetical protein